LAKNSVTYFMDGPLYVHPLVQFLNMPLVPKVNLTQSYLRHWESLCSTIYNCTTV